MIHPEEVAFILNSRSRKSSQFLHEVERLRKQGLHLMVRETGFAGHAEALARQAAVEGVPLVVAAGGDGTLHEVLNGILGAAAKGASLPMLSMLPLGSANDSARSTPFPKSLQTLLQNLKNPQAYLAYAGNIHYQTGGTRYFFNIADAGLGAAVVECSAAHPKWMGSHLRFFSAIVQTLPLFERLELSVTVDGQEWQGNSLVTAICNGSCFGSGIHIGPGANPQEAGFEVCIVGNVSLREFFRYLPHLRMGRYIRHPEIHYLKGREISIRGAGALEADGELAGHAPADFSPTQPLQLLIS